MLCPAETNLLNPHLEQTGWVIAIQTHKNISVCLGRSTNISDWCVCPDHLSLHPGSHNSLLPGVITFTAHVTPQKKTQN